MHILLFTTITVDPSCGMLSLKKKLFLAIFFLFLENDQKKHDNLELNTGIEIIHFIPQCKSEKMRKSCGAK